MDLCNTFSHNIDKTTYFQFSFSFPKQKDLKPLSSIQGRNLVQRTGQTHKVHFKAHQLKDYKWYPT